MKNVIERVVLYGIIAVVMCSIAFYKPIANNIDISNAENCYKSKDYACAFKSYKKAFSTHIDNKEYVNNYFNTLIKFKKITVVQDELNKLMTDYPDSVVAESIKDIFHSMKLQIRQKYSDTYIDNAVQGTNIIHWNNTDGNLIVYIENNNSVPVFYQAEVKKAFSEYHSILSDVFNFSYTSDINEANIIVTFVDNISGGQCNGDKCKQILGLTRNVVENGILTKSTIQLRKKDAYNTEFTKNQIHNIARHEIGHALGISGHSYSPDDVMYPVNNDASWAENTQSLLIRRKEFSYADVKTLELLYKIVPDITNKPYNLSKYPDMYLPVAVLGTKEEIGANKLKETQKYMNTVDSSYLSQVTLAEGYLGSKNYEEAKAAYTKALSMANSNEEKLMVYNNLALISLEEKNYDEAIKNAQIAKNYGETENMDNIIAYAYVELNQLDKAEKILENSIQNNPNNADYSAIIVGVYLKQHKYLKMFGEMKRIKKINPGAFSTPLYQPYKFLSNFV